MIDDRLSLLLIQLTINEERALEESFPNMVQRWLNWVLTHKIVPFI